MDDRQVVAVVQASIAGARIEMRDANPEHDRKWVDASPQLMWNFLSWEYRIKPEPPKPREWWWAEHPSGTCGGMYPTKEEAERWREIWGGDMKIIHVREVLPNEEGK